MDVDTELGLMRAFLLMAQSDVSYRVTSADPSDLEFTDGDWDGSQARQSMPNPSDEDADLSTLDDGFVFVPEGDDARASKGRWKCPFRQSPDGPAHVSGLVACLAAINGARNGVDGITDDALKDGYDFVVDALIEADHYDDEDDAPAFDAAADAYGDLATVAAQDDGFEPSREQDGMPLFQSRAPAEQAAEFISDDCTGAHEVTTDGDTWYGPCGDNQTAKDAFARRATAEYSFDVGDTVTWSNPTQDGSAPAYGIIRDRSNDGTGNFADRIDGQPGGTPGIDATDDNPAYLIEVAQGRDDGWVASGTMVGHRQDTLSSWSPDDGIMEGAMARATGSITVDRDPSTIINAATTTDDGDGLMGVIWGAGDHDLSLGGQATPVRVPPETIPATFEALQGDVDAGDVTLGFDHPDQDSVAAQTGIVDIGTATGVALTTDETHIVLTDSDLTNAQATEAAAAGDFDDLDWSVVADVRVRRDDDGNPVTDDDRVVLDATRIRRIDAVNDGAVDAASIERSMDALPDLKSELQTIQQAAQTPNQQTVTAAAQALQASASALADVETDMRHFDPDDYDDVQAALTAASDVVEDRQDSIDALAGAFEDVLEAAGTDDVDVDIDDIDVTDSPDAAAQAVIDAQTTTLRREIADLEADLARFDTSDDDVDDRAEALKGQSAQDLRALRNERAYQAMQVQQEEQTRGAAAAQTDTTGRSTATAGNTNDDADDMALSAMDGADRVHAEASGKSPAQYLQDQYEINASQYDDVDALRADVVDAATGGAD
jgi:hypothetical protein